MTHSSTSLDQASREQTHQEHTSQGSVPATARQLWLFVYFDAELEPARALALLCPLDSIPSMA